MLCAKMVRVAKRHPDVKVYRVRTRHSYYIYVYLGSMPIARITLLDVKRVEKVAV